MRHGGYVNKSGLAAWGNRAVAAYVYVFLESSWGTIDLFYKSLPASIVVGGYSLLY